jgi:hypothetical protein
MLRAFVNCAMVLTKRHISSFFNGQRRNKDHSALVDCGGIEFFEGKIGAFTIVCKLRNERKRFNPSAQ